MEGPSVKTFQVTEVRTMKNTLSMGSQTKKEEILTSFNFVFGTMSGVIAGVLLTSLIFYILYSK